MPLTAAAQPAVWTVSSWHQLTKHSHWRTLECLLAECVWGHRSVCHLPRNTRELFTNSIHRYIARGDGKLKKQKSYQARSAITLRCINEQMNGKRQWKTTTRPLGSLYFLPFIFRVHNWDEKMMVIYEFSISSRWRTRLASSNNVQASFVRIRTKCQHTNSKLANLPNDSVYCCWHWHRHTHMDNDSVAHPCIRFCFALHAIRRGECTRHVKWQSQSVCLCRNEPFWMHRWQANHTVSESIKNQLRRASHAWQARERERNSKKTHRGRRHSGGAVRMSEWSWVQSVDCEQRTSVIP